MRGVNEDELRKLCTEIAAATSCLGANPSQDAEICLELAANGHPQAMLCFELIACAPSFPMTAMKALTGKGSVGNTSKVWKPAVESMKHLVSLLKANDRFKERRPFLATHNTLKGRIFSAALFQAISAGKSSEGVLQVVKGTTYKAWLVALL